jgi:hypothetical protein
MTKLRATIRSATAALLLWTLPSPVAGQEDEPPIGSARKESHYRLPVNSHRNPTLILEDRYPEILADWSRGSATAAGGLAELERGLADLRNDLVSRSNSPTC